MTVIASEQRAPGARKPLLALAAGLLMPGLGQLYAGDFVRGVLSLFAVALAVPVGARLALLAPSRLLCFVIVAGVVAAIAAYLGAAIDAVRLARRHAADAPRSWQRPGVYALYTIVSYVFVLTPLTAHVRDTLVETFVVPTASMTPNILPGDRIIVDKTAGRREGGALFRGAIAVFVHPNDRTNIFIKRIVGMPGDRISVEGRRVLVNGHVVTSDVESSGSSSTPNPTTTPDPGPILHERGDRGDYDVLWPAGAGQNQPQAPASSPEFAVPNGQVFVLGDNRSAALDSRRFGSVPLSDVLGIARQVWFSSKSGEGVRWNRVGRILK